MIKVLFVCHGNICRSPMAEFLMRDLVLKNHLEGEICVESCATSREEIGADIHYGTKSKLREMNIPFHTRKARQMTKADYEEFDYIIAMDKNNIRNIERIVSDTKGKVSLLLDYTARAGEGIADPWYTGNFDETFDDILFGCLGLIEKLKLKILFGERTVLYFDEIDSTNNRAKALAKGGCAFGTIVIADSQTAGRGRFNRAFLSKKGVGLYMSLIAYPKMSFDESVKLTAISAVAVLEALKTFVDADIKIKWVNDLYLNGKKICGILTECETDYENKQLKYAVIGIGINLGEVSFPAELCDKATSIFNETGVLIDRFELAKEIAVRIENFDASYMEKYRSNNMVIGKYVDVKNGDMDFKGKILDIDENGFLKVENDGNVITVNAGEVIL